MNKFLSYATVVAQVALAVLFTYAFTSSPWVGALGGVYAFALVYFKSLGNPDTWIRRDTIFNVVNAAAFVAYLVLLMVYHWQPQPQLFAIIGGAFWGVVTVLIVKNLKPRKSAES
jgi:hypothetical protein